MLHQANVTICASMAHISARLRPKLFGKRQ